MFTLNSDKDKKITLEFAFSVYMNPNNYIVHTIPYPIDKTLEDMKETILLTPHWTSAFYCCPVAANKRVYAKQ